MINIITPPESDIVRGGKANKSFSDFLWSLFNRLPKTGAFTLDSGTTTTTVTDSRVTDESKIFIMALTANAAAETPYITVARGDFTVTHANTAAVDKTFDYMVV